TLLRPASPAPALLALLLPARLPAADIPSHPDQLTYPPFSFTPPAAKDHRAVLKSGPVVYVAENRELPIVNVSLVFRGGTYLDPPGKEGLSELAGYLLTRSGTKNRTPEELEERLAFLAAQLSSGWGEDRGTVSLNLLSKDLDEGLAILREVLTEPRFADGRIALRKDQRLSEMKQRNDESAAIEARERGFLAYGPDFYANRYETKASLEAITREDLVAFRRQWVHPRNVLVAVSGDVDRAAILKKLDALFAAWPTPGEAAPPVPKPSFRMPAGTFLVDKDVNQGRVSILLPGILRTDPDFFPAQVMNDVLGGGGFTSWIMIRVRSEEGLAYDARSAWTGGVWYPGTWRATFQSKVRTAAYAAQIVLEEVTRMREKGVTAEELSTSKASFVDTFPRRFSTKAQVAGALLDEEFTGRYRTDPNFYATYRAHIEKVTAEEARRAARKLLDPAGVTLLVVGKKADLLNPDPKHPVKFADLTGGKLTELPLRGPMTMAPLSGGSK
ncbi:MAG TPA: pitrilysin family protein, partial [Thermoanaerobaculia bacterium]|nr:pitrilysin family protein [Thermoanaerobaculia bacterium]